MVGGHLCKILVKRNGLKRALKKSISFKKADPSNALVLGQFPFRDVLEELDMPESYRTRNLFRDTPQRSNVRLLISFRFRGISQVIRIGLVWGKKICIFNSHHCRLHPSNILVSTSAVPDSVLGTEGATVGKGNFTLV